MIFVDTAAWAAIAMPTDADHARVMQFLAGQPWELMTSDYVIDETLTLLRARGLAGKAVEMGRRFFDLRQVRIHYLDADDIRRAWEVFRGQPQRRWSFTDCTSKVVMDRFHLKQALGFDRHFLEFGNVTLVP